ncbi:MAG: protein-L-isoaspartate(D-aspartate) O-methyltransferase [Candidatus Acidiferrales bacterium]
MLAAALSLVIVSAVMKLVDFFARRPAETTAEIGNSEPSGSANGANDESARREMVERQLRARGIHSARVLEAMATVPRHRFVLPEHAGQAYADSWLPIDAGQTISQPYMVGAMADALSLEGHEKVLEIGAGSGYQAAVLSLLAREVVAVEWQPALAGAARERLARLVFQNVRIESGDGSLGWPPDAPYDAILVTAGAPSIPPPLIEQLSEGGRLVIPVGPAGQQDLVRVVKRDGRTMQQSLFACRFVPLLGRYGWPPGTRTQEPYRG